MIRHPRMWNVPLVSWAALLAGCSGWPLYANLPSETISGVPPGSSPEDSVPMDWAAAVHEEDPGNDLPPEPQGLGIGQGLIIYGSLDGVGWDPDQEPSHQVSCGDGISPSDFPPLPQGAYSGDLDWFSIVANTDAQLCIAAEVTLPTDLVEEFSYDLLPYELDDCDNPRDLLHDTHGEEIELGLYATTAEEEVDVGEGAPVSVLLAGFVPAETVDTQVPWRLGLSLVRSADDGGNGVCPSLPEAP